MTVECPISPAGVIHQDLPAIDCAMSFATPPAAGFVASEEEPRSATPFSPSGSEYKQADSAMRRMMAADWIKAILDENLPVQTDAEFRASLRDGILLCKILNHVKPGTISRIVDRNELENSTGEVIQNMENVTNFLKGVSAAGLPGDYIFSASDLEDTEGPGERPKVADCLLYLKRLSEGKKLSGQFSTPARSPYSNALLRRAQNNTPQTGGTESEAERISPPLKSAAGKGVQAAVGVTRLMQQCTAMLRERMWTDGAGGRPLQTPTPPRGPSSTPESALEAMGPVLESVLGSLTQEYEKRLLAKDHDLNLMRDTVSAEQSRRQVMEAELSSVKEALESASTAAQGATIAVPDEETVAALTEAQAKLAIAKEERKRFKEELTAFEAHASAIRKELEMELMITKQRLDSLADIEESYKQVCDENRDLYNQVQDLKGAIRVYCRVRPRGKTGDNSNSCLGVCDGEIATYNEKGLRKIFQFDKVFAEESTQDDVYIETSPLIRSILDGYNVCIFAYGQTGSGKTHTMSGTNVQHMGGRGINYRALDDLFAIAAERSGEWTYTINVQMLEIYNEVLRDLLVDSSVPKKENRLDIRMTERSGNNVPEATQIPVTCTEDVLTVMAQGARNRAVGETKMNERSSRSHQVLTVMIDGQNDLTGVHTHACLNLIDLAGSERVNRSEAAGERLKEAQHINKSLSALGDVMSALANGSNHIPYRNSKLTQLLQDSLGGQAKTMMFMHIAPEMSSYGETISTLGFGTRVSQVTLGAAKQNREGAELFAAREAIARLEAGNQGADAALDRLKADLANERAESGNAIARAERAETELQAVQQELKRVKAAAAEASQANSMASTPTEAPPQLKMPLKESQLISGPGARPVTSHVQRLRSKENGPGANHPSKLHRPQTARTTSGHSSGYNSRPLTARGEKADRPQTAASASRRATTPTGATTPSRVPKFSRTPSAQKSARGTPALTGPISVTSLSGRTTSNSRQSSASSGRWM